MYQIDNSGRQTSKLAPKEPYLLVLTLLYNHLLECGQTEQLTSNEWRMTRWWDVTSEISL